MASKLAHLTYTHKDTDDLLGFDFSVIITDLMVNVEFYKNGKNICTVRKYLSNVLAEEVSLNWRSWGSCFVSTARSFTMIMIEAVELADSIQRHDGDIAELEHWMMDLALENGEKHFDE